MKLCCGFKGIRKRYKNVSKKMKKSENFVIFAKIFKTNNYVISYR